MGVPILLILHDEGIGPVQQAVEEIHEVARGIEGRTIIAGILFGAEGVGAIPGDIEDTRRRCGVDIAADAVPKVDHRPVALGAGEHADLAVGDVGHDEVAGGAAVILRGACHSLANAHGGFAVTVDGIAVDHGIAGQRTLLAVGAVIAGIEVVVAAVKRLPAGQHLAGGGVEEVTVAAEIPPAGSGGAAVEEVVGVAVLGGLPAVDIVPGVRVEVVVVAIKLPQAGEHLAGGIAEETDAVLVACPAVIGGAVVIEPVYGAVRSGVKAGMSGQQRAIVSEVIGAVVELPEARQRFLCGSAEAIGLSVRGHPAGLGNAVIIQPIARAVLGGGDAVMKPDAGGFIEEIGVISDLLQAGGRPIGLGIEVVGIAVHGDPAGSGGAVIVEVVNAAILGCMQAVMAHEVGILVKEVGINAFLCEAGSETAGLYAEVADAAVETKPAGSGGAVIKQEAADALAGSVPAGGLHSACGLVKVIEVTADLLEAGVHLAVGGAVVIGFPVLLDPAGAKGAVAAAIDAVAIGGGKGTLAAKQGAGFVVKVEHIVVQLVEAFIEREVFPIEEVELSVVLEPAGLRGAGFGIEIIGVSAIVDPAGLHGAGRGIEEIGISVQHLKAGDGRLGFAADEVGAGIVREPALLRHAVVLQVIPGAVVGGMPARVVHDAGVFIEEIVIAPKLMKSGKLLSCRFVEIPDIPVFVAHPAGSGGAGFGIEVVGTVAEGLPAGLADAGIGIEIILFAAQLPQAGEHLIGGGAEIAHIPIAVSLPAGENDAAVVEKIPAPVVGGGDAVMLHDAGVFVEEIVVTAQFPQAGEHLVRGSAEIADIPVVIQDPAGDIVAGVGINAVCIPIDDGKAAVRSAVGRGLGKRPVVRLVCQREDARAAQQKHDDA